jgi:hypothetical protein
MLPNALRVVLRPPSGAELTIGLRTGGQDYRLRVEGGWVEGRRGRASDADLTLDGTPWQVMATLLAEDSGELGAVVEGDSGALDALREMVDLPEGHWRGAEAELAAAGVLAT